MLRFTIRDLLWLMLVAAVGTCWWTERVSTHRRSALWTAKEEALQQKLALAQQQNQRLEQMVELQQQMHDKYQRLAKSCEELHAVELARLNRQLDRYESPANALEAEPGIYFLAPAR